jgi:methyl-accepting chemotaxis protein
MAFDRVTDPWPCISERDATGCGTAGISSGKTGEIGGMAMADVARFGGKMGLRTKMLLMLAGILIGFLLITLTVMQTTNRVRIGSDSYGRITLVRDTLCSGISLESQVCRLRTTELALSGETGADKVRQGLTDVAALNSDIQAGIAAITKHTESAEGKKAAGEVENTWRELSETTRNQLIPAVRRGDRGSARELALNVQGARYDRIASQLETLIKDLRSQLADREKREADYARKTIAMGLFVAGGILVIIVALVWTITGALVRAVTEEAAFADAVIRDRNLSGRLALDSADETGKLASSLNALIDLLHDMVAKVTVSSRELSRISHTLADASKKVVAGTEQTNARVAETSSAIVEINASIKEVSQGVDSLSLSASENSSSVLEMAASVEEVALNVENLAQSVEDVSSSIIQMAAAIKHINDSVNGLIDSSTVTASSVIEMDSAIRQVEQNALDTATISEEVRRDAETGKVSVEATISGMQEIKRSSHITHEVIVTLSEKANDIGAILSVINEVAEQTNLLALNAAIIAAQAGEQGKGFAVVADEIKELADRTSSSTREIEELIQGVQEETRRAVDAINLAEKSIADGELLSQKSGIALGKIVSGVGRASEQVTEIAHAAAEQAKGSQMIREAMERVTDSIMQIANATQQQSKGSELIMTAVERMKVLTSQVRSSTREQSKVGSLIAGSTENITSMIRQIKRACDEQSKGSEQIVTAVDDIQQSTHDNLGAAGTMEKAVSGLSQQVELLKTEISGYTLTKDR